MGTKASGSAGLTGPELCHERALASRRMCGTSADHRYVLRWQGVLTHYQHDDHKPKRCADQHEFADYADYNFGAHGERHGQSRSHLAGNRSDLHRRDPEPRDP